MEKTIDTSVSYTSKDEMFFSSTERSWHNKILKLAKNHPDEVTILARPENNDGCIYAKMPVSYLNIRPKRISTMTEEQRQAASDRLKKMRQEQNEDET